MPETMIDHCDQVLQEMVGTPDRLANFKTTLTNGYHLFSANPDAIDPYTRLRKSYQTAVLRAMPATTLGDEQQHPFRYSSLLNNAQFGGEKAVDTLRIVGEVYKRHAEVPQQREHVARNADVALRHVFGMAFTEKDIAIRNLAAYFRGSDPQRQLGFNVRKFLNNGRANAPVKRTAKQSFDVTKDEAGQLQLTVRHKRVKGSGERRCPSTFSQVESRSPEQSPSSLLTMLRVIGDVAITHIYPQLFEMAST